MGLNESTSILYTISEWIIRYIKINFLWFIFNIPLVFLLINLLMVENTNEIISICLIILAIIPFVFFPATAGMFAVIRMWLIKEKESPMIRSFWKFYKENYIRSMMGGLIIGAIWLVFLVDYYYFVVHVNEAFKYLFIFLFIFLLTFTFHFVSTTVHFESGLFKSLKNSLLITIGSPLLSVALAVITGLIVYCSLNYLTFLIPLIMGSIIGFLFFKGFYKVVLTIEPE